MENRSERDVTGSYTPSPAIGGSNRFISFCLALSSSAAVSKPCWNISSMIANAILKLDSRENKSMFIFVLSGAVCAGGLSGFRCDGNPRLSIQEMHTELLCLNLYNSKVYKVYKRCQLSGKKREAD